MTELVLERKTEAEKVVCDLFGFSAPIVFITGRFGFGKTDFALLIAQVLHRYGLIKKFGSNIKLLDSKGIDYTYITNLVALKEWLFPKQITKLFILDEAGINVDRRNPLGKLNRQIRYMGFLLRKFRGKLIFISQRSKDIESTFADTDIWLATFKKLSKTEALLKSNIHDEPHYLTNIPATSLEFDSYDIAPFTSEPEYGDLEAKSFERQLLHEYVRDGSFNKVAKGHSLYTQQVKRIVLDEIKRLLQSHTLTV